MKTANQLIDDIDWIDDTLHGNKALLSLVQAIAKRPYSMDVGEQLHLLLRDHAERDAEYSEPLPDEGLMMLRKQAGG